MRAFTSPAAWLALAAATVAGAAAAQEAAPPAPKPPDAHWVVSAQFDNDLFMRADGHYTHGTRLALLPPAAPRSESFVRGLFSLVPDVGAGAQSARVGYVLGQSIFTPKDTKRSDPISDDRPYAGWLYVGFTATVRSEQRLDTFEFSLGVVGPSALAKQTQGEVHRHLGISSPQGWANQLHDEAALLALYDRKQKLFAAKADHGLSGELIGNYGFALGNVYTLADAGMSARVGVNMLDDFGPPRIEPSLAGYDAFDAGLGAYVFIAGNVAFVARNIFLDGNTFRSSQHVTKEPWVMEATGGVVLRLGSVRLSYSQTFHSREFKDQRNTDRYGSIGTSVQF